MSTKGPIGTPPIVPVPTKQDSVISTDSSPWVDEYQGFEDILQVISPQGKFQKRFLYCFLCPLSILTSLGGSFVYIFFIPKHWCHDPNWSLTHATYEEWKNATIPTQVGSDGKRIFSSCLMYEDGQEVTCRHGWEYDRLELEVTMPSEYNWVCDREKYVTIIFTVAGISATLGTIILGPTIDRFGRRRIFVLLTIVDYLAAILRLFVPRFYPLFLAMTIFTSFIGASADIIVQELTDSEFRSWISATTFTVYVIGMAAVPWIVSSIRDWFYIGLVATVPRTLFLFGIITFFYIPESPRWLISVGRIEEAKEVIKNVAKINGTLDQLQDSELDASLQRMTENRSKETPVYAPFMGMVTLLSKPRVAINSFLLAFALAMNCFVYGGITLNTPYMPGNQFVTFFLLAIIEIPSSILGGYLMQKWGRRLTPAAFFGLSAIACFVASFNVDFPILMTVCMIVAKFSVNLTSLVTIVQDVEIFPTQFRATGSSFTGMLSQILCLGMPTIVSLGRDNPGIPYFVFGICSLLGIFFSVCLPETLHQSLPDTLEEANDIAKSQSFWSFLPGDKRSRRPTTSLPPVTSIKRVHLDGESHRRSGRRESVVSFVSQVHPTNSISRNRRQSVINYMGS